MPRDICFECGETLDLDEDCPFCEIDGEEEE